MNRFSDALNVNYKHKGISSTAVCPGYVVTEFHSSSGVQDAMDKVPAFMKLEAKDVAAEAVEATLNSKSYCVPSKRYKVLVFLIKYAPFLIKLLSNTLSGGRYAKK